MKKFQTHSSKVKLIISFCLLSLFFANAKSYSQELIPYEEPLSSRMEKSRKIVKEAEFIFQGIYLSESIQHTENHNLSIIKTVLLVQHVYKGNLKLGTVILQDEGPVPHSYKEKIIESDGKEYEWLVNVGSTSHNNGPTYTKNRSAIFFCNSKPISNLTNDSIDNKQILSFSEPIQNATINFANYTPYFEFFEMGGLNDIKFKTKSDFHKFLKENDKNIFLPLTGKSKAIQDSI